MNSLILSHLEMKALWMYSQQEIGAVAPSEKFRALVALVETIYPKGRNPSEIANRFYAMMVCIDSSVNDLDAVGRGVYGKEMAAINADIIEKLWDYFGDLSRTVDPANVVRASEII